MSFTLTRHLIKLERVSDCVFLDASAGEFLVKLGGNIGGVRKPGTNLELGFSNSDVRKIGGYFFLAGGGGHSHKNAQKVLLIK